MYRIQYLYAEYIMRNAGLEEAQAGIKIARRNINNLSEATTGITYEPWHYRYVGVEAAKYIMANNITLEEFCAE